MNALAVGMLSALSRVWPSPVRKRNERLGAPLNSLEFQEAYAEDQFRSCIYLSLIPGSSLPSIWGKTILEIGCGHGGRSLFLASAGAAEVVGIDLNAEHLDIARKLRRRAAKAMGRSELPVEYVEMNAQAMSFAPDSFDMVFADNAFEHFRDPDAVIEESFRVLRPGGFLVVPVFSSIYSKHGLHLKNGLKVPWANLIFSEKTIVETLLRRSEADPELLAVYPGLAHSPEAVRDVRAHKDLNCITHSAFRRSATRAGFEVKHFEIAGTLLGRVLKKAAPRILETRVGDVLSTGASAILRKPSSAVHPTPTSRTAAP